MQWVNMLKVKNCTYALVANLLYAVLLRGPSVNSYHWWNTVVIHYPSFVNMKYGIRIAHWIWHLGVGIILNQCRRFPLRVHACSHGSWLGQILSPYVCSYVSWLGYALGVGFW